MPKAQEVSKNIELAKINNPKTEEGLVWVNIKNAKKTEIEFLRKQYGFELRHLHSSLSNAVAQRPVIELTPDYLFIILRFPVFESHRVVPSEIEFFLGKDYLVTIHNGDNNALNSFFKLCKKDGSSLLTYESESSAVLLYEILNKLISDCFSLLDKNSIAISDVEQIIFSDVQAKAVSRILLLRRNIVNIRKIMQSHKNILKKLLGIKSPLLPEQLVKDYYFELIDHTKRIWEILENQKELIEIFNDTNESLMNDRMTDIIKTLTIFSVIVFPLTLFAGIFGMNTVASMPLVNNPYGFWTIIAMMLAAAMVMLLFFKRKKWL